MANGGSPEAQQCAAEQELAAFAAQPRAERALSPAILGVLAECECRARSIMHHAPELCFVQQSVHSQGAQPAWQTSVCTIPWPPGYTLAGAPCMPGTSCMTPPPCACLRFNHRCHNRRGALRLALHSACPEPSHRKPSHRECGWRFFKQHGREGTVLCISAPCGMHLQVITEYDAAAQVEGPSRPAFPGETIQATIARFQVGEARLGCMARRDLLCNVDSSLFDLPLCLFHLLVPFSAFVCCAC